MSEVIVEVQSVLPATGWFFGKSYGFDAPLAGYEPVVVFAQVLVFDSECPSAGVTKRVLPLDINRYSFLSTLVGDEPSNLESEIFYVTQYQAPNAD